MPAAADGEAAKARLRARALGALFMSGATIGLVSVLLPHYARADNTGLYSNIVLAYVGGAMILLLGSRCRGWMIHCALILGALLITRAIVLDGEPVSFYSVWFIWVGLYSFFFFSRRAAGLHVAFVAALYGWTVVHEHASSPVARWLTTVATLIVAGVFIDMLVRRAQEQASSAEASANLIAMAAEVARELAGLTDGATARSMLCDAAARLSGAAGVALWEPTSDTTVLRITATAGCAPRRREVTLLGPYTGAGKAFLSASPVEVTGPHAIDLVAEFPQDRLPAGTLWKPLVREHTGPTAVLAFYWRSLEAMRRSSTKTLTELLTAEAAATLERLALLVRLESIARTDELTGLPNRRAWHEQFARELDRARRADKPLCVAMLDLDHFKRYNDRAGHLAGDRLLKETATAWCGQLRPTDLLARYGGEEFLVALPGCSIEQALQVIERVRESTPAGQTCSAGLALWSERETADGLVSRADQALYEAKHRGRNQSIIARTVPLLEPSLG